MDTRKILVKWEASHEIIEIKWHASGEVADATSLVEVWLEDGDCVNYETTMTTRKGSKKGMTELRLSYLLSANRDLAEKDVCWGTAILLVNKNHLEGDAWWEDDDDPDHDGPTHWFRLENAPRKRVVKTQAQREQALLKKALVRVDKKCAISEETQAAALDAAHLLSVGNGGLDTPLNAFLLRADLHRLFDAGLFSIRSDGRVKLGKGLSEFYREELQGKRLSPDLLKRIGPALVQLTKK